MRKIIFLAQIFLFLLIQPVYAEKIEKLLLVEMKEFLLKRL